MTLLEILIRYVVSGVVIWLWTFIYAGILYARAALRSGNTSMFEVTYDTKSISRYIHETPWKTVFWLTVWPYGTIRIITAYIKFVTDCTRETLSYEEES